MSTTNNEEKWIGTTEAAEFLGVKPATIRDWIRKGKDIPRKKIDVYKRQCSICIRTVICTTLWMLRHMIRSL